MIRFEFDELSDNLKKRLALPLPGKEAQYRMAPTYRPTLDETDVKHLAGVTILLYPKNDTIYFPLIERPVYNGAHSGQISFPGGKKDKEDKNLVFTALRECEEEIGVDSSKISVLGNLTNLLIPVSKFDVYPVVGIYKDVPSFIPQTSEVVSIIEVPLHLVLNNNITKQKNVIFNGIEETVPYYDINNKMVWGATAMILSEFSQVCNEVPVIQRALIDL